MRIHLCEMIGKNEEEKMEEKGRIRSIVDESSKWDSLKFQLNISRFWWQEVHPARLHHIIWWPHSVRKCSKANHYLSLLAHENEPWGSISILLQMKNLKKQKTKKSTLRYRTQTNRLQSPNVKFFAHAVKACNLGNSNHGVE